MMIVITDNITRWYFLQQQRKAAFLLIAFFLCILQIFCSENIFIDNTFID